MVSATSRGSPRRCSGASAAQPSKISCSLFPEAAARALANSFKPVGCGEPRADVVDQNSIFAELVGQALDQADHRRTHRIREHEIGDGLLGSDRGDGDDASPALALHVRDDFAREINCAEKVQLERALPFFECGGEKTLGGRAAGVGDADIDAAELSGHGGDETADGRGVGDVEGLSKNLGVVLLL